MNNLMRATARAGLVAALAVGAAAIASAQSGVSTVVNGSIASVGASAITVTADDGSQKSVAVGSSTLVIGVKSAMIGEIKPGDPLAVTADRQADGTLTATRINIFSPELWSFVKIHNGGQFPMKNGQIMTNEQFSQLTPGPNGSVLTLTFGDQTATITVPTTVQLSRIVTQPLTALKAGLRVMIRGSLNDDGSVNAGTINIGPV